MMLLNVVLAFSHKNFEEFSALNSFNAPFTNNSHLICPTNHYDIIWIWVLNMSSNLNENVTAKGSSGNLASKIKRI